MRVFVRVRLPHILTFFLSYLYYLVLVLNLALVNLIKTLAESLYYFLLDFQSCISN